MSLPVESLDADILIIGAGGAGLLAALHAHELNPRLKIAIAVKGLLGQSGCTRMVQGGYNAVLNPADSLERHFADTIKGGGYLNNQELAWTLVQDAPKRIVELENKVGCVFDRNPDGTIHQKPFAGQSFDRTVHKGDLTGIEIMSNLRDYILEAGENVRVLQECRALDLLGDNGSVSGALLLDIRTGRLIVARAKATLVATGGGATMYRISSPSLEKAGDGMAMARRAGAVFVDMEMLQFHPTGLLVGTSTATGGLLEEGLRGAGAHLYNGVNERFMERYDPKLERATRDVVSRASYAEIVAGRGSPSGGVYIDARHLGEEFLLANFPGMVERCADYGFDLLHDRVEVSPSAHFQMGGIKIDVQCKTKLEGLFAAGEDAGGVHGANRLGGNGVADSIVFGGRAGDSMTEYVSTRELPQVANAQVDALSGRWTSSLSAAKSGDKPFILRKELENLMWDNVGLVRNGPDLDGALRGLESLRDRARHVTVAGAPASNPAWNALIDLTNLCDVGQMVALGAAVRTESRGAHYRDDHPSSDSAWLENIVLTPSGERLEAHREPVRFTRSTPTGER